MLNDQCRIELRKGGVHMFTRVVRTVGVLLLAVAPVKAQSLMYRPPNLGGTWVPEGGVVQFNFVHRFSVSPGPFHEVQNFPTFTVAAGLGHDLAVGLHFATTSLVGPGRPSNNESEWYARWGAVGDEGAPGLAVAVT